MTTLLRRVLEAFEEAETTIRLDALSHELGIDTGTLDNMLQHWVRRGLIREVQNVISAQCGGCGVRSECPFVMPLPRRYLLVRPDEAGTEREFDVVLCNRKKRLSHSQ
jgi:hypothetical protein